MAFLPQQPFRQVTDDLPKRVDYIKENVEVFFSEEPKVGQAAKIKRIGANIELLKKRQGEAQHRRSVRQEASEKLRILQRFRWPLVKFVR